jgi:hypothetical protein
MALMLRRGRRRRPSRTTPHRHPAAKRRLGSAPPVRRDLRAASYPRQRTERAHDLRSFRNVGDACWCPASQHVGSLISAGSATSTTRRESAERESPSLPGVSGGVPLKPIDFPRAGGWEQPRPCCGENADVAHRAQRSQPHPASKRRPRSAPPDRLPTGASCASIFSHKLLDFVFQSFPSQGGHAANQTGHSRLPPPPRTGFR